MMRCRQLAPFFLLLLVLGLAVVPAPAAGLPTPPDRAEKFVAQLGSRAVTLLANIDEFAAEAHQAEFKVLVREGFDLELIGRFVLGNTWRSASADQQREYQRLFAIYVLNSYARRLGAFKGETFKITASHPFADTDALIETEIDRPDGAPIKAGWRVREIDGKMKIIDVVVEGVSMALTQRQEFASVIQRTGLDGLIRELKSRVDDLHSDATQG